MANIECCKSCQHCVDSFSSAGLWCRLRKIRVHSKIASLVFCHHWTQASIETSIKHSEENITYERQLEFEGCLINSE